MSAHRASGPSAEGIAGLTAGGVGRTVRRASTRALALVAIFGLFALLVPEWRFVQPRNIENILVQSTVVATAAIGATLVILAAGIDLSVGSAVALAVVVVAATLKALGGGAGGAGGELLAATAPAVAALAGIAAATAVGVLNGAVVAGLRVGPFIATLGTMQIVRGLAKGAAGNSSVYAPDSWLAGLLESTRQPGRGWMLLPPGVWLMLGLAAAAATLVRFTAFGRHVVAIGSNEETARLCGVRIGGVKLSVYALAGACAGLAGVLQFSYIGLGDPTTAGGLELYAIAAAVIGGASLRGGEGSIFGAVAGALIIGVLNAGGVQMGWPSWLQQVMAGAIIIGAVALERRRA